jgi:arylsulfatase
MDVGCEVGEPVSPDYGPRRNAFSGKVSWVRIDIDEAAKDSDHLIGAAERFQVAMARQ